MALTIHRNKTAWMYRINEHDACLIQRRKIARDSRWQHFRLCDTAQMAREIILVMQEELEK
jgi:hypothetical protein